LSIFLASTGISFLVTAVPRAMVDPPGSVQGVFFGAVFLLSGIAIYRTKLRQASRGGGSRRTREHHQEGGTEV
jgi:hypothetical protein